MNESILQCEWKLLQNDTTILPDEIIKHWDKNMYTWKQVEVVFDSRNWTKFNFKNHGGISIYLYQDDHGTWRRLNQSETGICLCPFGRNTDAGLKTCYSVDIHKLQDVLRERFFRLKVILIVAAAHKEEATIYNGSFIAQKPKTDV